MNLLKWLYKWCLRLAAIPAAALVVWVIICRVRWVLEDRRCTRTLGEMRTLATAVESYSIDSCMYLNTGPMMASRLVPFLEPTYVKRTPMHDDWSSDLQYVGSVNEYTIVSWGADRRPGGGGAVAANGGTTSYRNDIVFATGSFVQYPDGRMDPW